MADPKKPALASPLWWRDLLSRAARQSVQFLIPVVALAKDGHATKGLNWPDILVGLAVAVGLTVLRMAVDKLRVSDSASKTARIIDRAAAAFLGTAAGLMTTDWVTVVHGLNWQDVLGASATAAVIAVVMGYTDPGVPAGTDIAVVDPTPTDATVVEHDGPVSGSGATPSTWDRPPAP